MLLYDKSLINDWAKYSNKSKFFSHTRIIRKQVVDYFSSATINLVELSLLQVTRVGPFLLKIFIVKMFRLISEDTLDGTMQAAVYFN